MAWVDTYRVLQELQSVRDLLVYEVRSARDVVRQDVQVLRKQVDIQRGLLEAMDLRWRLIDVTLAQLQQRPDVSGEVRQLLKHVLRLRLSLLPVGDVRLTSISEGPMSQFKFGVQLPALPEDPAMQAEIVKGRLRVTIAGGEPLVIDTQKGLAAITDERFVGPQDAPVTGSFAWVDDAGNESANPSTFDGVLLDTVPPADPGALALVVLDEILDAPVIPVDPPVEIPVDGPEAPVDPPAETPVDETPVDETPVDET